MRLFVIGGSGFLGRNVLRLATGAGHTVTALVRSPAAATVVQDLGAQSVSGDLTSPRSWYDDARATSPDAILHLASMGMGSTPTLVENLNVTGLRAVFISTTAVKTSLAAPTKATRLQAEDSVRSSSLSWTILRPTMIYGQPGDRNIERLLAALPRMPFVPVPGTGAGLQQPVHVEDLATAVVTAVTSRSTAGMTIAIPGPEAISFETLIRNAQEALGQSRPLVKVPMPLAQRTAAVARRLPGAPSVSSEQLQRLEEDKSFDISDARLNFGHKPRSFAAGVFEEVALLNRRNKGRS